MESCNGTTHSWSDDSYSQGSYPCPGPDKCANAAALQRKEEDKIEAAITKDELKAVFGYDEVAEKQKQTEIVDRLNAEREAARLEAVQRLAEERERFRGGHVGRLAEYVSSQPELPTDTQEIIRDVCDRMRDFLLDKNAQYGDSAIDPVRIFSKASPIEQLLVRIDDKLSRIEKGDDRIESDDDVIDDLIGYFILLKVAKRKGLS